MYTAGQFLEVREGVTVRLNKDTAEIANAAGDEWVATFMARTIDYIDQMRSSLDSSLMDGLTVAREVIIEVGTKNTAILLQEVADNALKPEATFPVD